MKYKKLTGICKEAIEKNMCLGCVKLEQETFEGIKECKYVINNKNVLKSKYEQIKIK